MAGRTLLGKLRLALLLVVLLFVALGTWLDRVRSRDWDATLRVTVYPLAAVDDPAVRAYVAGLAPENFAAVDDFLAEEAERYDLPLERPTRLRISRASRELPPALPPEPGMLDVMFWSLRLRWFSFRVAWNDPLPAPDVQIFASFAPARQDAIALPDSVGLSKGLVAVAHLYAGRSAEGSNAVVLAHELLHTLGATDKYSLASGQPLAPGGLGEPERAPLYPQDFGEIMAGRIAVAPDEAAIPEGLDEMVVGPDTAREIGWTR